MTPPLDPRDVRITKRILATQRALDRTLDDVVALMRRIQKHRSRLSKLHSTLRTPVEVRRERARRATVTRTAVPTHRRRGIRVSAEDGGDE
jgi:hypothetical protein